MRKLEQRGIAFFPDGVQDLTHRLFHLRIRRDFALKGGDLIALGLPRGPIVAKTLQELRAAWSAAGFPPEAEVQAMARAAVAQALRASQ